MKILVVGQAIVVKTQNKGHLQDTGSIKLRGYRDVEVSAEWVRKIPVTIPSATPGLYFVQLHAIVIRNKTRS